MSETEKAADPRKIITPEFRVSFPHVFKPQKMPGTNNALKYSVVMLFPKDTDITPIKKAIAASKRMKFGKNKEEWPKMKSPIADGDGEAGLDLKGKRRDGYAGHWVVKASTREDAPPGVVNRQGEEILKQSEFYAGCYARAAVFANTWEFPEGSGKFGVSFILDHLQKTKDGKSFGGKVPVSEVFGAMASDEDDTVDDSEDFD